MLSESEYKTKIDTSLPNPLIDKSYRGYKDYDEFEWAWEFLRRNTKYQDAYFKALTRQFENKKPIFPLNKWGMRAFSESIAPYNKKPPHFYNNRFPEIYLRKNTHKTFKETIKSLNVDETIKFKVDNFTSFTKQDLEEMPFLDIIGNKLTINMTFSSQWDIDEQLKTAKEILNIQKEVIKTIGTKNAFFKVHEESGFYQSHYLFYIRAFDLHHRCGKTINETMNIMYDNRSGNYNTVQQYAGKGDKIVYKYWKEIINLGTTAPKLR